MSTTLIIIIAALVSVLSICLCIHFKDKLDDVQIDNAVLKQRKGKLEEQIDSLNNQLSSRGTSYTSESSGVEILKNFAQAHQIQLEEVYEYQHENWELYQFTYQGGRFYCYAEKRTDEVLLRYSHFEALPYSEDMQIRVLQLCDGYTSDRSYAKLTYNVEKDNSQNQVIYLHLYYDIIGASQDALERILSYNFLCEREVSGALDDLRKTIENEQPQNTPDNAKSEADFQEMAIRMALKQAEEKIDTDINN